MRRGFALAFYFIGVVLMMPGFTLWIIASVLVDDRPAPGVCGRDGRQ